MWAEAALTLIDAVRLEYNAAKRARAVLDYDDLIAETLNLLKNGDATAWVLYKLDGGIDHVLHHRPARRGGQHLLGEPRRTEPRGDHDRHARACAAHGLLIFWITPLICVRTSRMSL